MQDKRARAGTVEVAVVVRAPKSDARPHRCRGRTMRQRYAPAPSCHATRRGRGCTRGQTGTTGLASRTCPPLNPRAPMRMAQPRRRNGGRRRHP